MQNHALKTEYLYCSTFSICLYYKSFLDLILEEDLQIPEPNANLDQNVSTKILHLLLKDLMIPGVFLMKNPERHWTSSGMDFHPNC